MRKISVAHLTAIHLDPPTFIREAAKAGFDGVGLRLIKVTPETPGYPMADKAELQATLDALDETGLTVPDIEFIKITPEFDIADYLPTLDTGAALSARHVISAPYDDDLNRLSDSLGTLAEAAHERGIKAVMEFFPWTVVPDLATCWQVVQNAGPLPGILIDALHFDRSGSTHAQIADIPADRLPFAHLCDAPVHPPYTTDQLLHTARENRLAPGLGQIDLTAFLNALPADIPVGLEVPRSDGSTLADIYQATRQLLDRMPPAT